MKIIITDDDRPLRMHLSKALTRRGHHVLAVSSGDEAITRAHNEQFDAAVIDLKMVGMGGLQVLKELKEIHPQLIGVMLPGTAPSPMLWRPLNSEHTTTLQSPVIFLNWKQP